MPLRKFCGAWLSFAEYLFHAIQHCSFDEVWNTIKHDSFFVKKVFWVEHKTQLNRTFTFLLFFIWKSKLDFNYYMTYSIKITNIDSLIFYLVYNWAFRYFFIFYRPDFSLKSSMFMSIFWNLIIHQTVHTLCIQLFWRII